MRKAVILYNGIKAGELTETDDGDYLFQYDSGYISNYPEQFLTFSIPVRSTPYKENRLFPFFEGLIPEGWLLKIATENWKLNPKERMGLLLACCQNCIGAVSVQPIMENHEK